MTVTPALPLALAVLKIDASQNRPIESKDAHNAASRPDAATITISSTINGELKTERSTA